MLKALYFTRDKAQEASGQIGDKVVHLSLFVRVAGFGLTRKKTTGGRNQQPRTSLNELKKFQPATVAVSWSVLQARQMHRAIH